jgi:hypothetical protein
VTREQANINGATEELTDAVCESYRTVAARAVSAQEHNATLVQKFFSGTINNLHAQAEENRQTAKQLAEQQRRTQEAAQVLVQESVSVYLGFANSVFAFYGEGLKEEVSRSAEKNDSGRSRVETRVETQMGNGLPLEVYDSLNAREIIEKLEGMSPEAVRRLRTYEASNKNRRTVMERFNQKIASGSS